jgi:GNAT superfamily N-acetyltransferase
MDIQQKEIQSQAVKFFVEQDGKEVGRAFLYLIKNDLHPEPYGLMEDVFIDESLRGQGLGTELVKALIVKAKELGCYKLIATSRHERAKVHELYERLGFRNHGLEFRIDFK